MDAYRCSGHMPLFEEVKQKMLEQIKNGIWTPDSMLPNEFLNFPLVLTLTSDVALFSAAET